MTEERVAMVKRVVHKWCTQHASLECRFDIFKKTGEKSIFKILNMFRNGKTHLKGVPPISDLGISDGQDFVSVWSSNIEGMRQLHEWAISKGYETSGLWV